MKSCCAILVNYHGAADIAEAVKSILLDAPELDIVVVDNSNDAHECARLAALLPSKVRVLNPKENLGFGRGCNLAWSATSSKFVFFVNPDVRLDHGCTRALLQAMEENPALAAVAPRQFLDQECEWHMPPAWLPTSVRAWVHEKAMRDSTAALRVARAARAENLRLWTAGSPIRQRALSGGVFMLRRSALPLDELPFDPRFFMYFEDSDLCMRLRRQGAEMAIVPSARAVHAWRNLPHKATLMADGARVYFDKYYPDDRGWLYRSRSMGPLPKFPGGFQFSPAPSPAVPVASEWQAGWLLELSPSPLLQPAIGMLGSGDVAQVSQATLSCFEGASVYGRLGGLSAKISDCQLLCWSASK